MTHGPGDEYKLLERRKEAVHLKYVVGLTWDEVAKATGYSTGNVASTDVQRHMKKLRRETDNELEHLQQQQDVRYDAMRKRAYSIMVASHPLIQNGKVVKDDQGRPVQDYAPQLAALQTLLRIESQWAALHGTEASKKLEIALNARGDIEANLVAEAVLAAAEVLNLEPAQRMLALETAAARLEVLDAEVISDEPG